MGGAPRAPLATRGFFNRYGGRGELKYVDVQPGGTAITTAGAVTLLNGVTQGADINNRIGRKITMKSILFRGFILPSTTSAPNGDTVRFLLVYDTQPNSPAAIALVTDILNSANYYAPLNLSNRDRFRVLCDKYVHMAATTYTAGALSAGDPVQKSVKFFKKLNHTVTFSSTTNAIGNIATGGLYMLWISQAGFCLHDCYSRVRFTDE